MPNIYMKHPIHGTKVAFLEAEAVADEARGWVRCEGHAVGLMPTVSDAGAEIQTEKDDEKKRREFENALGLSQKPRRRRPPKLVVA